MIYKALLPCLLMVSLAACDQRMDRQPKYQPLEAAPGFADGRAARHPPPHTISREQKINPELKRPPLSKTDIQRGRARYDIYCRPCHGVDGGGNGPVVRRGYPKPPTYHTQTLRDKDLAYFVDIITHGYGVMYAYADRVALKDRWRIAAYIRALQLSRHLKVSDYPNLRPLIDRAENKANSRGER